VGAVSGLRMDERDASMVEDAFAHLEPAAREELEVAIEAGFEDSPLRSARAAAQLRAPSSGDDDALRRRGSRCSQCFMAVWPQGIARALGVNRRLATASQVHQVARAPACERRRAFAARKVVGARPAVPDG
jgi:hypothetical protein